MVNPNPDRETAGLDLLLTEEPEADQGTAGGGRVFRTMNRISLLLLFGTAVGFGLAIAGFIADMVWVMIVGSCLALVMSVGWILVALVTLFVLGRDVRNVILGVRVRGSAAKDEGQSAQ